MEKKVALVTGARSGIGNAAAKALREKGVIVILLDGHRLKKKGSASFPVT